MFFPKPSGFFFTSSTGYFRSFFSFFFYIAIDAFGLHIHIRLLKFCLPHWFPSAHCNPSLNQLHSAVENFRVLGVVFFILVYCLLSFFYFLPVHFTHASAFDLCSGDEGIRTPDLCLAKAALSRLSYIPDLYLRVTSLQMLVGLSGLEPETSPLSEARSNQLS